MFLKRNFFYIGMLLITITNAFSQTINSVDMGAGAVRQFVKTEFDVQLTASYSNPFDYKDIALDMVVTSPSGKAAKLPCYFVSGNASLSTWKARFTPRESGNYVWHFELRKNEVMVVSTSDKTVEVLPTARKGFLHKNNLWTFRYDNGEIFRGVGENYGWEPRDYEESTYRGVYTYDFLLPKLARNGVNFFRTWMCPWNLPLQWKKVTQTNLYHNTTDYFNAEAITRMDHLVNLCDSLGLHMMLTLDYHGALSNNWSLNNFNSANGGPIATPAEFFTNSQAKEMYKNRLRYLVARWGYSPAIGAWEFFNEIDNAVFNESNGGLGNYSHADVTAWHNEMSTFLKSIDPYEHLVTTSVSHRDISGMNALQNLDFNQRHVYGDPYVGQIDQTIQSYITATNKPYVIGEFGYRYEDDNYDPYANNWKYDFRQGMWLGLFSPTPILPMTWWWEMFDAKAGMTKYFNSISEIQNKMRLAAGSNADFAQVTASSSAGGQKVMAVRAGNHYYVYVLNTTSVTVTTNITVNSVANGSFTVRSFDPKNGDDFTYTDRGTVTSSTGSLTVTANTIEGMRERILIITPQGDHSGEQSPTGSLTVPGKIEAEDFDNGGESVAYHDYEAANTGGQYRTEGVDIETSNTGGYDVTNIVEDEWTEYTVDVQASGSYTLTANVASILAGKSFHVEMNGENISGAIAVPQTGNNQIFQTVSVTTALILQGKNTMKIVMDSSGFNLDYVAFSFFNKAPSVSIVNPSDGNTILADENVTITANATDDDGNISKVEFFINGTKAGEATASPFTFDWSSSVNGDYTIIARATDDKGLSIDSSPVTVTVYHQQTPFQGQVNELPGKLEAEDYDQGGEGTAYHDLSPGNKFNQFRTDDVDIETCLDAGNGYSLGDLQTTEWVEYSVNVAETNHYDINFRIASAMTGGKFHLEVDGVNASGSIAVPNTSGWQTWKDLQVKNIFITMGTHVLRLYIESEYFNLNYMTFSVSQITTGDEKAVDRNVHVYPNPFHDWLVISCDGVQPDEIEIYDNIGRRVVKSAATTVLWLSNLPAGVYYLLLKNNSDGFAGIRVVKD